MLEKDWQSIVQPPWRIEKVALERYKSSALGEREMIDWTFARIVTSSHKLPFCCAFGERQIPSQELLNSPTKPQAFSNFTDRLTYFTKCSV
jgi:hypothetical protein